jgi:hypothetical protein
MIGCQLEKWLSFSTNLEEYILQRISKDGEVEEFISDTSSITMAWSVASSVGSWMYPYRMAVAKSREAGP